ncbi:uncharacterized protein LOC112576831 isoform X1 [Pomacea canaliculata]|uniref:uncharacterized protein LOC112576831 isoform X1 n=1 Tax=Pomacea canaliculata TaxID=400727 RepID=UPI000D731AC1|nr:uncharacterized protein LOC112576831 isoform X1 [Pomacea canaliculata]
MKEEYKRELKQKKRQEEKEEREIKEEDKRKLKKKKRQEDEVDRLKDSVKEKEDKKADAVLRSGKKADEKDLVGRKGQTGARRRKVPSQTLQEHIKKEIHKEEDEKREVETEEESEESIASSSLEDEVKVEEKTRRITRFTLPESPASSTAVFYEFSPSVINETEKAKGIDLWRQVVNKMVEFSHSVNKPFERNLFEVFLKLQLQNAKNKLTSDKELKTIDSEGIEHAVYTRQISKYLIQVNKLPADLRFFVEANRFKKQITSHLKCSTEIGIPIEKENPILGMRAKAIIECFFQSVCEPVVQINLCSEKYAFQIIQDMHSGLSADMFYDVYLALFSLLFNMWKIFAHQWLSTTGGKWREENIKILLTSFKDPIIGDFPHPDEPSADYLHLTLSNCNNKEKDKDVKDITGSMLKFTISRGVRLLVNEAEQKKSSKLSSPKPLAINENGNNFYKVTDVKNMRDNVFFETQYQNKGKIDQSNNCPGNSDMTESHVEFPVYAKTLECRERKRDLGIGRSKVPKTCNNILQDRDCVVAMEERGLNHQPQPEPKQKGEVYSAPEACSEPKVMISKQMGGEEVEEEDSVTIEERGRKHKLKSESKQKGKTYSTPKVCSELKACSEPRVMTSEQMSGEKIEEEDNVTIEESGRKHKLKSESKQKGVSCRQQKRMTSEHMIGKNTEEEINDGTSAQKNQVPNDRSESREIQNKQKLKFRGGDKQTDNNSNQKFTKQADRDTNTLQKEMSEHGKQDNKLQAENRTFMCVSDQPEELQLLSPDFLSRSLPKLDGCLQLQDSQSVWGPGKRPFKGDYAVQVSRMITLLCESRQASL